MEADDREGGAQAHVVSKDLSRWYRSDGERLFDSDAPNNDYPGPREGIAKPWRRKRRVARLGWQPSDLGQLVSE